MSMKKRLDSDPELRAILEGNDERLIRRVKQLHRDRIEQEARDARRRARVRRLTFGLLGR
jgi:hypothetical protein